MSTEFFTGSVGSASKCLAEDLSYFRTAGEYFDVDREWLFDGATEAVADIDVAFLFLRNFDMMQSETRDWTDSDAPDAQPFLRKPLQRLNGRGRDGRVWLPQA